VSVDVAVRAGVDIAAIDYVAVNEADDLVPIVNFFTESLTFQPIKPVCLCIISFFGLV